MRILTLNLVDLSGSESVRHIGDKEESEGGISWTGNGNGNDNNEEGGESDGNRGDDYLEK